MFYRLKEMISRLFYGRYGADKFTLFLFIVYAVLMVISRFMRDIGAYLSIYGLCLAVLIYAIFRVFSKNFERRTAENEEFLKIYNSIKNPFGVLRMRIRDRKARRYRKCKSCGALLRLPVKKGKHTVRCPKCGANVIVKIIF